MNKYPSSSPNHFDSHYLCSITSWEVGREEKGSRSEAYLMQDVLCHAPFQMEEMADPEGEEA